MSDKTSCPNCGISPLIRFNKDENVYCNHCDALLVKGADDWSRDKYVVCPNPKCRFDNLNPEHSSMCERCGTPLLHL